MKLKSYLFCILCVAASLWNTASAVPAPPITHRIVQADGSVIHIIRHGDEFQSWLTTTDGYSVAQNAAGFFEYVAEIKAAKGQQAVVLSGIRASDPDQRSDQARRFLKKIRPNLRAATPRPTAYPTPKGQQTDGNSYLIRTHDFASQTDFKGIAVPVHFSDYRLTFPAATFDSMMNCPDYNGYGLLGSVRDYYHDMSQGQFTFSMEVLPPYTARKGRESYGQYANDLKAEVIAYAQDALKDRIGEFDRDKDGYIDHISIVFAGQGQESMGLEHPDMIWSHQGVYQNISMSCIAEMPNYTELPGIGTFCHEFGHALGLPDLYDTDYEENGEAEEPGGHDLMAGGITNNPTPLSAFSRFSLGWLQLKTLSDNTSGTYELRDILKETYALRINTATPGEFFVLENRTAASKWQQADERGAGLLIFRVDSVWYRSHLRDNNLNAYAHHPGYELMRADNHQDHNNTKGDFFPYNGQFTAFTDATTPSAKSLNGQNTNQPVTNIRLNDDLISFDFVTDGQSLMARSGIITPDSVWGLYRVSGGVIRTQGQNCSEKGIYYSLTPTPGSGGEKITAKTDGNDFVLNLDLRTLSPGALIHVWAYATDGAGQTVYGAKRQVELPRRPIRVTDTYTARKKDNDYTDNLLDNLSGLELDLSAMSHPRLELYGDGMDYQPENAQKGLSALERGNLLVSSDNGSHYRVIEPTEITSAKTPAGQTTRRTYALPDPSASYRILVNYKTNRSNYASETPDSAVIRSGAAYQKTAVPLALNRYQPVAGNAYENPSADRPDTVLSFNSSTMQRPILYVRLQNGSRYSRVLVKQAAQPLYTYQTASETGQGCPMTFRHYSVPPTETNEGTYTTRRLFRDMVCPLPADTLVHVLLSNFMACEVVDMGEQQVRLQSLQAIDNQTVELYGFRYPDGNAGLPLGGQEYGLCWNTVPTPALTHKKALSGTEADFVCPLTDLPAETLYFYTYAIRDGKVFFSDHYLTSEVVGGQRANAIASDADNPVTVIHRADAAYTLRVRFSDADLSGATAQGICYDEASNALPTLSAQAVYHEGTPVAVNYYTLTAQNGQPWANIQVRPFILGAGGAPAYQNATRIETCAATAQTPYRTDKVLAVPCNLITEAASPQGTAYWQTNGSAELTVQDAQIRYEGRRDLQAEPLRLYSPRIDQTDLVNPLLCLSADQPATSRTSPFSVYAIDARTGKKTLLSEVDLNAYANVSKIRLMEIPTKAGGDTIYLMFEFPTREAAIQLSELRMENKITPSTYTYPTTTDEAGVLSLNGYQSASPFIPAATTYGFVYSTHNDPLLAIENADNPDYEYERHTVTAQEDGFFSMAWMPRRERAHLYLRAFATNDNGTTYGELYTQDLHGSYVIPAERLPVTDPRQCTLYKPDGSPYMSDDVTGNVSGILQLAQRPEKNMMRVTGQLRITVYGEGYMTPFFYFKAEGSDVWQYANDANTGTSCKVSFVELRPSSPADYNDAVFDFALELPRNTAQIQAQDLIGRPLTFDEIVFAESNEPDLMPTAPNLIYASVENGRNAFDWQLPDWYNVEFLLVERARVVAGLPKYEEIFRIEAVDSMPTGGHFVDYAVRPETGPYTYRLKTYGLYEEIYYIDASSTLHVPMRLQMNRQDGQWLLHWNPYTGRYLRSTAIYRGNRPDAMQKIAEWHYKDDFIINNSPQYDSLYIDTEAPEGEVYYQVAVVLEDDFYVDIPESQLPVSYSNIATNAEQPSVYYTVHVTQGAGGTISVSCNGKDVKDGDVLPEGSVLRLTATAESGNKFGRWSMDGSKENPRDWVLNGDVTISGIFVEDGGGDEPTYYDVIIKQTNGGTVKATYYGEEIPSACRVEEGVVLKLSATAKSGYRFEKWMDGNRNATRNLTVNRNLTISATFVKETGNESLTTGGITAYPNPMGDLLHIVSERPIERASLCNAQGVTVWQGQDFKETELSLPALPQGIYMLRCHIGTELYTLKIVKR